MSASYKNHVFRLFEYNIVGSGDKLMAYAALGMWEYGLQSGVKYTDSFLQACRDWAARAVPIRGFSYVTGKLVHHYHGDRSDRGYVARVKLLEKYSFDPARDVAFNGYGVLELQPHQRTMQAEIDQYFVGREAAMGVRTPPAPGAINQRTQNTTTVRRQNPVYRPPPTRTVAPRVVVGGGGRGLVPAYQPPMIVENIHQPYMFEEVAVFDNNRPVVIEEIYEGHRGGPVIVEETIFDRGGGADIIYDNFGGGGAEYIDYAPQGVEVIDYNNGGDGGGNGWY